MQVVLRFLLSLIYAAWTGIGIAAVFGMFSIPITVMWTVAYVLLVAASWVVIFLLMSPDSTLSKRLFDRMRK